MLKNICVYHVHAYYIREKVKIPYDKPYIMLKGEGKRKTHVVWDDHDSVAQSPTFTSMADNIVVKCLSFKVRKKEKKNFTTIFFFFSI